MTEKRVEDKPLDDRISSTTKFIAGQDRLVRQIDGNLLDLKAQSAN